MNKTPWYLLLIISTLILTACASPARVEKMAIPSDDAASKYSGDTPLKDNITVYSVTGGESTNPMWTSEIASDDFKKALVMSLEIAKLLSKDNKNGKYFLDAKMIEVDQPIFGASLTVTSTIKYTLTDRNNKIILDETIETPYTATMGDAFLAVERLKLANEGSAQTNIAGLIQKLYDLKIEPSQISLRE